MNDHDYRYEELQDREYERNRRVIRALIQRDHGDVNLETYTDYIMSNYDIGSLAFGTVSLLVDDLFVCDQCGEGEDKEYRSELFEHEDICITCAGNGR